MSKAESVPMADLPVVRDEGSLFYLTNRMNLNGILASRLVAPRESFGKYYADLLEASPQWVPLLRQPPSAHLMELVTNERGSGAPVLIEFPPSACRFGVTAGGAIYMRALRLAEATVIHFPDSRSLREHRARMYSNVHPHYDLLHVTPELFSGTGCDVAIEAPEAGVSIDWQSVDRVRGALSAAVAYGVSGAHHDQARALLGGTARDSVTPRVPPWLALARLDDVARREPLPANAVDAETATFAAIYKVLGECDVEGSWAPSLVIARVRELVRSIAVSESDLELIGRNLKRVHQLVDAEVGFEPFRATSSGLITAKALILVLLRPDLAELLSWPVKETGADELTMLTAAIMAGRLRGLSRESTLNRQIDFDDITAAWAVRVAHDPSASLEDVGIVWDPAQSSPRLHDNGSPEGAQDPEGEADNPLVTAYNGVAARSKASARLRVARAMGWPITTLVKVPTDAQITSEAGFIEILTMDPVKLVESIAEDQFIALANSLSDDLLEPALTALRPRGR